VTPKDFIDRNLQGRVEHRPPTDCPPWLGRKLGAISEKIFFTNDANLELLKGYKSAIQIKLGVSVDKREIHVVITGFSPKAAQDLFDKVKAMYPEEIKGVNE
jgi:hypothetical protein